MTSNTFSYEPSTEITEQWESGQLGQSLDHAIVASPSASASVDDSLGLQLISIRLQRSLLERLKLIANYRGVAYQPLIRDQLNRFAEYELKDIIREIATQDKQRDENNQAIVQEFVEQQQSRKQA
ncbi:MAG: hypothetical protein SGI99_05625 [Pseudomonadota bacterium]|nr:hypothetical protein [Pseudomonadota bacterium]